MSKIKDEYRVENLTTGEITLYPPGSDFRSPAEVAATQAYYNAIEAQRKQEEEKKQNKYFRKSQIDGLGSYVLLRVKKIPKPDELSAANLGRLIYLSTYCDYNNRLMFNERTVMQRNNFDEIMNLSKSQTRQFISDMKKEGTLYIKDDAYYISNDFLYRGERREKHYTDKMMVFIKATRNLYQHLEPRNHKYFGILIQILPYVNRRFNIVCQKEDVNETDIDKIRCLTIVDICRILNYGESHYQDVLGALTGLFFSVDGYKQAAFSCVTYSSGNQWAGYMFIINPRLFYIGSDYNEVLAYTKFFPKKIRAIKTHDSTALRLN